MSQVFISYKRKGIEFAEFLESKLKEANFNVGMDTQIPGGVDWQNKIDEEIRKSICKVLEGSGNLEGVLFCSLSLLNPPLPWLRK